MLFFIWDLLSFLAMVCASASEGETSRFRACLVSAGRTALPMLLSKLGSSHKHANATHQPLCRLRFARAIPDTSGGNPLEWQCAASNALIAAREFFYVPEWSQKYT